MAPRSISVIHVKKRTAFSLELVQKYDQTTVRSKQAGVCVEQCLLVKANRQGTFLSVSSQETFEK